MDPPETIDSFADILIGKELNEEVNDNTDALSDALKDRNKTRSALEVNITIPDIHENEYYEDDPLIDDSNIVNAGNDIQKVIENKASCLDELNRLNFDERPSKISEQLPEAQSGSQVIAESQPDIFGSETDSLIAEMNDDRQGRTPSIDKVDFQQKEHFNDFKHEQNDNIDGNERYNHVENDKVSVEPQMIDFDAKLFDSAMESIDCDMCFVEGKVVSPTSYCYACQIYLCGSCYKFHTKIPATRDHSVIHRNDLIKNVYKETATYHGNEAKVDVEKPLPMNRNLVEPGRYTSLNVKEEDSLCGPCKLEVRKEPGSAFCVTCTQYLCVKCKTHHRKFGASMDHEVVHKHDIGEKDFKTFVPALNIPHSPRGKTSSAFGSTSTIKTDTSKTHSRTIKLKHPKTFSALIYHDIQNPQITGMDFIGDGKLLVCDRRNKSLKLFSDKLTPLSSLNVPGIADVTALNDNTAVVTQPEKSVILYIGFKDKSKMFVRRTIPTKGHYFGVDSLHGELYALCMADLGSQATIHVLSTTGQVLSVIHPHLGQGYDLQLQNSSYFAISPAGGTFYISDSVLGVIAIGTDGRAIFSCQSPDIERPCGIKADSKNIYVCCPATSSLVTISPDGRYFSDVLSFNEDMALPNCVALTPNSLNLAVAFLEGETINLYKNTDRF